MMKQNDKQLVICERLTELGYERERHIRLYGEEFRLISNPIPDGDGFAVEGIAHRSGRQGRIRIPLSVIHTLEQELNFDARPNTVA